MAKICIRDCFIVDYISFKKGEIIRDKKDLEKIGDSSNFEDYQVGFVESPEKEKVEEKAVEKKPVKKMPIKKMKKRSKKKNGGEN